MLPPSTHHPLTHRRQTTMSIAASDSSTSSTTSLPQSMHDRSEDHCTERSVLSPTSLDQSIANLLSNIPGESVGLEAVESGKRFWATLVKTVSAAAGGTVPEPEVIGGDGDRASRTTGELRQGSDDRSINDVCVDPFRRSPSACSSAHSRPRLQHRASRPQWPSPTSSSLTSPTSLHTPAQPVNAARLPRLRPVIASVGTKADDLRPGFQGTPLVEHDEEEQGQT
jgi:hypothetical protein